MECCVCLEKVDLFMSASFSTEGHCRKEHALCVTCYAHCVACPLCRYHPAEKPPIYAEAYLDTLRERKHHLLNMKGDEYTILLNKMNDVKTILNSIYTITNSIYSTNH